MKKILSAVLVFCLLFGSVAVMPAVLADADTPYAQQMTFPNANLTGTAISYTSFNWDNFGENLVPDPKVEHFVDDGNGGLTYGKYAVPVISWRNAIELALNMGYYAWNTVAADYVHPSNVGNAMIAEMMAYLTENAMAVAAQATEPSAFIPANIPAVISDKYMEATIYDRSDITADSEGNFTEVTSHPDFSNGWATTSGGSITFTVEFKNLGILCQQTSDDLNGKVNVYVDGVLRGEVSGVRSGGGGTFCHSQELYSSSTKTTHTVTITVQSGTKDDFQLLGLLIA